MEQSLEIEMKLAKKQGLNLMLRIVFRQARLIQLRQLVPPILQELDLQKLNFIASAFKTKQEITISSQSYKCPLFILELYQIQINEVKRRAISSRPMQQGIIIKAQCTIFRNNMQINCKKKSKLSAITLEQKSMHLIITGKGENQVFKFAIQKLKSIHKRFIQEGKITIEFDSEIQNRISKGLDCINENIQYDGNFQIFISNACPQNLQTLINQISALKKKIQESKQKLKQSVEKTNEEKNKKKIVESAQIEQNELQRPKLNRKNMFNLTKREEALKNNKESKIKAETPSQVKARITLLSLPRILLREIFSFSGINLSQRLISKDISDLITKNIMNLKLKEQTDQQSFHKLAKWAINLQGRFKNVKTLKLEDRYDQKQLIKNRAKTLKFSTWKQISSKHIVQLKGLRIYCLQLPYLIKFELSHLFGLRLAELRLKGKQINVRNSMVKDEDLLYLINNVQELKVIEVAYASVKLLSEIKKPQKMEEIKIGNLNRCGGYEDWSNFKKFQNLRVLSIQNTQKLGNPEDHQAVIHDATFPQKLITLEIGFNLSCLSKSTINPQLRNLKLLGTHFKNKDVDQFFLPGLETLDIVQCPNLTPQCLEHMANLKVFTNWNRNQVESATNYYSMSNIVISSVRGFSYC